MLRYLPLLLKNSLRNRRRSALTILSIAASLCLLGVLFALYRGLFLAPPAPGQELRMVTHHKVSITQSIPAYFGDKISRIPGVQAETIWQWFGGTYKDARDQNNFFARFAVEPVKFFRVRPELVMPDDQKQAFLRLRTAAIASADLAERMHWKIGEKIFLTGDIFPVNPELTLVGIFNDASTTVTLFFSQEYLREMLGSGSARQDMVGAFEVQAASAEQLPGVARAIDEMFASSQFPTSTESEQQFGLQFMSFLGNLKLYLMAICGAVTFTIVLVSANTMAMSVRERVREVGILKTLGYTRGAILFMILGEAGVISLVGGAIGLALAAGLVDLARHGPSVLFMLQTLSITAGVAALSLGVAMFIGIASALIPAWSAARTSILDCLRSTA